MKYWSDTLAEKLKERHLPLEGVDDMKTPSGRVHMGALRGLVIHDLVYKSLQQADVPTRYTYVYDDHDPMDGFPVYLPEEFKQYMGMPLYQIPSPGPGAENFAQYFANEFTEVFNKIGCHPEIIWASKLYEDGKMNDLIRVALDHADDIREIYEKMYKKEIAKPWYPYQPYCPQCKKVATTTVTDWDGEQITFTCEVNKVNWTQGCGYTGKMSPFSHGTVVGKLPWKIEWPAVWKVIGVTVEGAGKDHMSAGGSHDVAKQISEKVFHYETPYPIAYEWFNIGGKKMSSSKGVGTSAAEMLELLPPELVRFLMVRTDYNKAINFDPFGDTIPALFDEYQRAAQAYTDKSDELLARMFELSQINGVHMPPKLRFSVIAQLVQMPNMKDYIASEGLESWAHYARNWVEKYAPEDEKFSIQESLPEAAKNLTTTQKELLARIAKELDTDWEAEKLQFEIYEWGKAMGMSGKEVFSAIYTALIGKDHGPKAAWLILSLEKNFVQKRFEEAAK